MNYKHLSEQNKKEICSWKYSDMYSVYNLPSAMILKANRDGFYDPLCENEYYGYFDGMQLVGYFHLEEFDQCVFVGLGVKPDLVNKGYGTKILQAVDVMRKKHFPKKYLSLIVRTWNTRAIHTYEKVGYKIVGNKFKLNAPGGMGEFYRMEKK